MNKAFANIIAYMAMDEGDGIMRDFDLPWNIFLDEQYWALSDDQKVTSHKICPDIKSTTEFKENLGAISYGKASAFLRQLVYFIGKNILKDGLKYYFRKY